LTIRHGSARIYIGNIKGGRQHDKTIVGFFRRTLLPQDVPEEQEKAAIQSVRLRS
jgi:hypothetical protein